MKGVYQINGFIYITGFTTSTDLPLVGAYQGAIASPTDAFVAKFDATQSGAGSLVFSTYLGGGAQDVGRDIAADKRPPHLRNWLHLLVRFPLHVVYRLSKLRRIRDAFLTVINPFSASIAYSTFFGGPSGYDESRKLIVDPDGKRVAIAGFTFPGSTKTQNAYQPVMPSANN